MPVIKKVLLAVLSAALLVSPLAAWLSYSGSGQGPMPVLTKYLKALYARDLAQAYRFISTADQRLKSRGDYVRERGAFTGFTREAAVKLAQSIEVRLVSQRMEGPRDRIRVALKLPDANGVAPLLLEWDEERLNALTTAEQRKILAAIDDMARSGKLPVIEGEEEFVLVRENSHWRVFLNWAAGVKIKFATAMPKDAPLVAEPISRETVARSGDVFSVGFKVKNRSSSEIRTRIAHHLEPARFAEYLDLVECALLLPVRLGPGEEQVYNSTYMVRGDLPEGIGDLNVVYEFTIEP